MLRRVIRHTICAVAARGYFVIAIIRTRVGRRRLHVVVTGDIIDINNITTTLFTLMR